MMDEFETRVCGIPCIVRVTSWERYVPAKISGPVENCYPAEGGCGEWELLDLRGRRAQWLERKMKDSDISAIDEEVFEYMEQGNGSADY